MVDKREGSVWVCRRGGYNVSKEEEGRGYGNKEGSRVRGKGRGRGREGSVTYIGTPSGRENTISPVMGLANILS